MTVLQASRATGYFTRPTLLAKVQSSQMTTCVVAGTSRNGKPTSIPTTIIGTTGGTRFGGCRLVRAGGGKQHGTGDSELTGGRDVLLGRGDPVHR